MDLSDATMLLELVCCGKLKPQESQAILDYTLGLSYLQIGKQHGWSESKVRRCIYEGRKRLRTTVGGLIPDV